MILSSLISTIVFLHPANAATQEMTADEIMKKSTQHVYMGGEESTYTMSLTEGDGGTPSTRKMKVWFKRPQEGEAKLLIKFAEPAEIRGTGLLSVVEKDKTPDQWLYIPAYKKTRRIKGGNEDEAFLGSDFTIGDLTVENEKRFDYKSEGKRACGAQQCYVLVGTPKSGVEAPYSKKILEIRTDNFLGTKAEFYGKDGKLEKVLELQDLKQDAAGKWSANKMEMKNLQTKHKTLIEVASRGLGKVPADSVFTTSNMERN